MRRHPVFPSENSPYAAQYSYTFVIFSKKTPPIVIVSDKRTCYHGSKHQERKQKHRCRYQELAGKGC